MFKGYGSRPGRDDDMVLDLKRWGRIWRPYEDELKGAVRGNSVSHMLIVHLPYITTINTSSSKKRKMLTIVPQELKLFSVPRGKANICFMYTMHICTG